MDAQTEREVKTRITKLHPQVTTKLRINWNDMDAGDILEFAESAIVIKLQSQWKKNGIPSGEFEVNAVDFRKGIRAKRKPQTAESLLASMDVDARRELILQQMKELGLA